MTVLRNTAFFHAASGVLYQDAPPYTYYRVAWFASRRAGSGAVLQEITLSELRFRETSGGAFVTPSSLTYGVASTNAAVLQDGDTGTVFTGQLSYVSPPDERIYHGGWFEATFSSPVGIRELVITNSTSTAGSPSCFVIYGSNNADALASQWTTVGTVAWEPLWAEIGLTWTTTETKTFTKTGSKTSFMFHKILMESQLTHPDNGLNIGQMQLKQTAGGALIEGSLGGGPRGSATPDTRYQTHEANNDDLLSSDGWWSNGGLGASESGWSGVAYSPRDGMLLLLSYNTTVAQELVMGCHNDSVVAMPNEVDYYTSRNGFDYTLRKQVTGMNTPAWANNVSRTFSLT